MIKTYFKNIEELRQYLTVDISSELDVLAPYLRQSHKYVIQIIGDELNDALITYLHTDPVPAVDDNLENLLEKVRAVSANFGYYLAVPKLNVNVGNTGITVTVSQNLEIASKDRVAEFRNSVLISGYDAQEELLIFLEKNKDIYPTWVTSSAYSFNKKLFINNALQFNEAIIKDISRLDFLKLKPFIFQLENFDVKACVGSDLFDELKTQFKDNSLSVANQKLLTDFINPALCYLSYDKYEAVETYRLQGINLLKQLRDYLNKYADNYTTYKNSDLYEEIIIETYNDETKKNYVFK